LGLALFFQKLLDFVFGDCRMATVPDGRNEVAHVVSRPSARRSINEYAQVALKKSAINLFLKSGRECFGIQQDRTGEWIAEQRQCAGRLFPNRWIRILH
jgi:hypothetical protein